MHTQDSKVVVEIKLAIIMAQCNTKAKELKRLFEGECCALAYNSDDEWFDDEDEEFQFDPTGSNKWFEDAFVAGMKEREIMQRGCVKRKNDSNKDEVEEKVLKNNVNISNNKKH
jgi:hypothetical protein